MLYHVLDKMYLEQSHEAQRIPIATFTTTANSKKLTTINNSLSIHKATSAKMRHILNCQN